MTQNHPMRIHALTAIFGLLVSIPIALFVSLNVLRYELGLLSGIEITPIHPVLLVGGAMAAVLLNAWSILELRVSRQDQKTWLMLGFVNHRWNLAVLILAAAFSLTLFAYVAVENMAYLLGV